MFIEGSNNPGNKANVDSSGRVLTYTVDKSEQGDASGLGDAYNLNTGNVTFTSAAETPLLYFKNDTENSDLVITRVFLSFGASAGGSGPINATIYANPTGGTITTAGTDNPPGNFNFGSSKSLGVISKTGATGQTISGGTTPIKLYYPSDSTRNLTAFDNIVLPRGASLCLTVTPPAGNTSLELQGGLNIFIDES